MGLIHTLMLKNIIPRKCFYLTAFVSLCLFPFFQMSAFPGGLQPRQTPNPIRIIDSDEQSVIVELTADMPYIETIPQESQNTTPDNHTHPGYPPTHDRFP